MKFIIVDTIPKRRRSKTYDHKTRDMIEEFSNSQTKLVKVDISYGDYKTIMSAYNCLRNIVKTAKYPIKVTMRNGDIYLKHLI